MDFFGEVILNGTIDFSGDHADIAGRSLHKFETGNFQIYSKKGPLKKNSLAVFLFGNITGISATGFSLDSYDNQEDLINDLYVKFGDSFIDCLEGYFLIMIADKDSVYFFNSRYSGTSCYYYHDSRRLVFCDEYKPLLKNLREKSLNWDVISLFLNSGYSYSEKMPFKDTYRLIPGYFMQIKKGNVAHKRYYSMEFSRKPVQDISSSINEYESLWTGAISDFCRFNKINKLGSALSGGLDTSWVVWCASKAFHKKIDTYTCYYQYSLFNELKEASYVTRKIGGIHHKIEVTERDMDLIPEMISSAEEPVLSSSLAIYKMIKNASGNNIDAFLTGDGGNNIYHHLFPVGEIHKYLKDWPYPVRLLLFRFIDSLAKMSGNERLWEARYPLQAFSYRNFYDNFYKNLVNYRHFNEEQRKMLLKERFNKEFDESSMLGRIKIRKDTFDDDLISARFVFGNMQYVSAFQEKFAKKFNMRLFPPYQNRKIMDFLCSLPYGLLFRGNTFQKLTNKATKMYFQKLALCTHFPKDFVYKTGQPFDQPFHGWFERRPNVLEELQKQLIKRGWYNEDYITKLFKENRDQYQSKSIYCQLSNHAYRIMALLALEVWAKEFIDGKKPGLHRQPLEKYLSS